MRAEGNRARARNDAAKRGASFGIIIHRRYANHGAKVALVLKSVVPLEPECFIRMKSTFNSLVFLAKIIPYARIDTAGCECRFVLCSKFK